MLTCKHTQCTELLHHRVNAGEDIFFQENKSSAAALRAARNHTCTGADADQQALQQGTISFVLSLLISSAENKLNKSQ